MGIKRGIHTLSEKTEQTAISEDEAALYDRQIRLWGLESQNRLRDARILLIGLGGLGAEVAKNIALAGVKSISLLDEKLVEPHDRTAQFLVADADIGKNRAEASQVSIHQLNPNVEVKREPGYVVDKSDDYFADFTIVCATDCSVDLLLRLNKICREKHVKFFCGDVWGFFGYCFVDLFNFSYLEESFRAPNDVDILEPAAKKINTVVQVKKELNFGSLERVLSFKSGKSGVGLPRKISNVFFLVHILMKFRESQGHYPSPEHKNEDIEELKIIRKSVMEDLGFDVTSISDDVLSCLFGELSPVCAVVGGVLAQEIIKSICAVEKPLQNFFLFNGYEGSGVVENIGTH